MAIAAWPHAVGQLPNKARTQIVTATGSVNPGVSTVIKTGTAAVTLTLPPVGEGRTLHIYNMGASGAVTLAVPDSATEDGSAISQSVAASDHTIASATGGDWRFET